MSCDTLSLYESYEQGNQVIPASSDPRLMCPEEATGSPILRVSDTADGTGNGLSWASPMTLVQAITTVAVNREIWVKEGVYGISSQLSTSSAFRLYGGFKGTEILRSERPIAKVPTSKIVALNAMNSLSVVIGPNMLNMEGATATYVLDSVEFDGANINNSRVIRANPGVGSTVFLRSIWIHNSYKLISSFAATALFYSSNVTCRVCNCIIEDNVWVDGTNVFSGAIQTEGPLVMINTIVRNNLHLRSASNTALSSGMTCLGGGTIVNSVFYGNMAFFPSVAQVCITAFQADRTVSIINTAIIDSKGTGLRHAHNLGNRIATLLMYNSIIAGNLGTDLGNSNIVFQNNRPYTFRDNIIGLNANGSVPSFPPVGSQTNTTITPNISYVDSEYRPLFGKSYAIDNGNNLFLAAPFSPFSIITDLYGFERIFNKVVDIGPVEFGPGIPLNYYRFALRVENCTEIVRAQIKFLIENSILSDCTIVYPFPRLVSVQVSSGMQNSEGWNGKSEASDVIPVQNFSFEIPAGNGFPPSFWTVGTGSALTTVGTKTNSQGSQYLTLSQNTSIYQDIGHTYQQDTFYTLVVGVSRSGVLSSSDIYIQFVDAITGVVLAQSSILSTVPSVTQFDDVILVYKPVDTSSSLRIQISTTTSGTTSLFEIDNVRLFQTTSTPNILQKEVTLRPGSHSYSVSFSIPAQYNVFFASPLWSVNGTTQDCTPIHQSIAVFSCLPKDIYHP
jgi:hypothetical protein